MLIYSSLSNEASGFILGMIETGLIDSIFSSFHHSLSGWPWFQLDSQILGKWMSVWWFYFCNYTLTGQWWWSFTTVHWEAVNVEFIHSWVQRRRDTGLGLVEGCPWWMVKLHSHISGFTPLTTPPLSHSNINEWQESDIPRLLPAQWRTARGPRQPFNAGA